MPKYRNQQQSQITYPNKDGTVRTIEAGETFDADPESVGLLLRQGTVVDVEQNDAERNAAASALGVTPEQNAARNAPQQPAATGGNPDATVTPPVTGAPTTVTTKR